MKVDTIDVAQALPEFYLPYSAYVLQTRALPDARDGLKTGARFILYSQHAKGITHNKPFKKGVATVTEAMSFSPHGDQSIWGNAVRMAQPYSLRYPVIEAQGNTGSPVYGDDFAAMRYLEVRGGAIASDMMDLLPKDTIKTWKLNYSQEKKYPTVLPTKFPFSLVNGSFGIGISCSSSIPQFNLKEVCDALVKLIKNPESSFEDLYCPIDFATGATIINESEVKESLKNGRGRAALIRAKMHYDKKTNSLIVTEVPYQVFTNTIMKQLQKAIDEDKLPEVDSVFDGTGRNGVEIQIKLTRGADPEKVTELLYRHTSLQSSYSINMLMLKDGKVPHLFSWKGAMSAYLSHLVDVLMRSYKFDLQKVLDREEILLGLKKALPNIDKIIKIIKESENRASAHTRLMAIIEVTDKQADAILSLRLASLSKLEQYKIDNELSELAKKKNFLTNLINDKESFNKSVISEILSIKEKYGDERRSTNTDLKVVWEDSEDGEASPMEIVEEKRAVIHTTSTTITAEIVSSLFSVKNEKTGVIQPSFIKEKGEGLYCVTEDGYVHFVPMDEKGSSFSPGEKVVGSFALGNKGYISLLTSDGKIKKISLSNVVTPKRKKIITLTEGAALVSALKVEDEGQIGILTKQGFFCIINIERERETGVSSRGIKAIDLADGDEVIIGKIVPTTSRREQEDRVITFFFDRSKKEKLVSDLSIYLRKRGAKGLRVVLENRAALNFDAT